MPEQTSPPPGDGTEIFSPSALRDFDPANDPDCVLGRRWLCKGGSLMIVGNTGTGKSSLMMQFAVRWAVGKDSFGIKPKEPLRSIIAQGENNFGDVAEAYQGVVAGAKLTMSEIATLDENLLIVRNTTAVGDRFPEFIEGLITSHRATILFVDPLLSFAGFDISDQEATSTFLRHRLDPILRKTGCILVFMHHTTKPKPASETDGQTNAALAYTGAGSADWANYSRECAALVRCPGEEPIYKFILTKRRSRAGLKDINGNFAGEILIRHSSQPGVIAWEYAIPGDETQGKAQSAAAKGSPRRFA